MITYNVYRDGDKIAEKLNEAVFTDTNLLPFTTYEYHVSATNEHGTSPLSNKVTVTTDYANIEESNADKILGGLEKSSEKIILTAKATVKNPHSLEVDHSHGKNGKYAEKDEDGNWFLKGTDKEAIPEFTVYASSENVWGSEEAQTLAENLGVKAQYYENEQTWIITITNEAELVDIINDVGDIEFYLVVSDIDGKKSGNMMENDYVYID